MPRSATRRPGNRSNHRIATIAVMSVRPGGTTSLRLVMTFASRADGRGPGRPRRREPASRPTRSPRTTTNHADACWGRSRRRMAHARAIIDDFAFKFAAIRRESEQAIRRVIVGKKCWNTISIPRGGSLDSGENVGGKRGPQRKTSPRRPRAARRGVWTADRSRWRCAEVKVSDDGECR